MCVTYAPSSCFLEFSVKVFIEIFRCFNSRLSEFLAVISINIKNIASLIKRFKDVYTGIAVLIFVFCNFAIKEMKRSPARLLLKHKSG